MSSSSLRAGPLSGVRIIIEVAGPGPGLCCGMMLADMGADAIAIERSTKPLPESSRRPAVTSATLPLKLEELGEP